jgi:hypothetical protein
LSELPFTIVPLGQHERASFSCGSAPLDHYFERQVSQDIRRRITACYVAVCNASNQVAGFYTLSAAPISVTQLPDRFKKNLPRYPSVPAVRIGRLAIDMKFQGQGLGSTLLINAIYVPFAGILPPMPSLWTPKMTPLSLSSSSRLFGLECARAHPVCASGTIRKGFFFI